MKRTVTTDALETLGCVITSAEKRDAIHLAVEPVIAGAELAPGQHITVRNGIAIAAAVGRGLGIVDPFLAETVYEGYRFWMVLYPRTVRSLRHVWSHPAFPDETPSSSPDCLAPKERAFARIAQVAAEHQVTAEELIEGAKQYLATGRSMHFGFDIDYRDMAPFWLDYEVVTDEEVPDEKKGYFFSCKC